MVLRLESVEGLKATNLQLWKEADQHQKDKAKVERMLLKVNQDRNIKEEELKESQIRLAHVTTEMEQLRVTTSTTETVLNGQIVALKDQVEKLSTAKIGLESHNCQLERQLQIATTQLERQSAIDNRQPTGTIAPDVDNRTWTEEKQQLETKVRQFMEMNTIEMNEWKQTAQEQSEEILKLKEDLGQLQTPTLPETAQQLWGMETKELGRRVCDVLHKAPTASSLEEQYQWDKVMFKALIGELSVATWDVFRKLWEVCTYWGKDNLLVEIILREDQGVLDPLRIFLTIGDLGARVFLYYRNLEGMMQYQRERNSTSWERRIGVDQFVLALNNTTQTPGGEDFLQWKQSINQLSVVFEDEQVIKDLVEQSAQRIKAQGSIEIFPNEYVILFNNIQNRLRRCCNIEQFLELQPFDLEGQVTIQWSTDEPGHGEPTQIIPVNHDNMFSFLSQNTDCLDATGQQLNWPTLMWMTQDSGPSRRAEDLVPEASTSAHLTTISLGRYPIPLEIMHHPLYCNQGQRRRPWIVTATPSTFPYNWPIIQGDFSSSSKCQESYHRFFEQHRTHCDPVCFRAALFSLCLGNWCQWYNLVVNVNVPVSPERQDWAIFSKLHYQCARHIRIFEEMCVTGFLIGAADQFTNEMGHTRMNGLKQFHEWQKRPLGDEVPRGRSSSPIRKRVRP